MNRSEATQSVGSTVFIKHLRDNIMDRDIMRLVEHRVPLIFVKITKDGLALLEDPDGNRYSRPIREIEIRNHHASPQA